MMERLRTATNHIAFKVILAIIILGFVFTGLGGGFLGDNDDYGSYVAKVNGEKINRSQVDEMYEQLLLNNPTSLTPEMKQQARKQIIGQFVNDVLAYDFAYNQGVRISDEQTIENIRSQSIFHVNGQFDNNRYLEVLRLSQLSPAQYAESLRDYMIRIQYLNALIESDFILPVDLSIEALDKQTRSGYTANISLAELREGMPEFSEEAILSYYDESKENYKRDNMVRVQYVGIALNDIEARVEVTDKEIEAHYKENISEFTTPEERNYRLIQVKTEQEATDIISELNAGADFQVLAKERSMFKGLRDVAGEMGWFSVDGKSDLPAAFIGAGIELNQYSGVIPLDGTFSIVRLEGIRPAVVAPLESIKEEVKKSVASDKVNEQFESLQKKADALAKENPTTLEPVSTLLGIDLVTSLWIEEKDNGYNYFTLNALNDELNNLMALYNGNKNSPNSETIFVNQNNKQYFYFMRISDYFPAGIMPLSMIPDLVRTQAENRWLINSVNEKAERVMRELDKGNDKVLQDEKISFASQYNLTRTSSELLPELRDSIFNASVPLPNKTNYGYVYSDKQGATFYALTGVKNGEIVDDKAEKSIYYDKLASATHYALLSQLTREAKIEMAPDEKL